MTRWLIPSTRLPTYPGHTSNTRAVNFCNQMYVLGGGFTTPSNEVDIYDPASNTWSLGVPFPTAGRNFAADTDGTNNIWKAGGYASDGATIIATTELFNCPVSPCASPSPTPTATATATADSLNNAIGNANGNDQAYSNSKRASHTTAASHTGSPAVSLGAYLQISSGTREAFASSRKAEGFIFKRVSQEGGTRWRSIYALAIASKSPRRPTYKRSLITKRFISKSGRRPVLGELRLRMILARR